MSQSTLKANTRMVTMKKYTLPMIVAVIAVLGAVLMFSPADVGKVPSVYSSEEKGIQFSYPTNYFVANESTGTGERVQHAMVLAEDTPENRELFSDPASVTEGPTTIRISLFQNDIEKYSARDVLDSTDFANFKLSDGMTSKIVVNGETGLRFRAGGVYENENVVIARNDYVYVFTGFFTTPTDPNILAFDEILKTVVFTAEADLPDDAPVDVPTGILPFNSGVSGTVFIGPTCPVMRVPPDPNCADRPYPTTVQVIAVESAKGSPFAVVDTDKEGRYRVILPPGKYSLQAIGGSPFPMCETKRVNVGSDTIHEENLLCDTGVR